MAEKILNTRIQLKYDTYDAWLTADPVLKAGEMAIATLAANKDGIQSAPTVLIKVGDGKTQYSKLQWASGKAADVYTWAKAENKPTYTATEIGGLAEFISGEIQDTNTTYKVVAVGTNGNQFKLQKHEKADGADVWTDVGEAITIADKALAARVTANEGAISGLQEQVGTGKVDDRITTAVNGAKTELKGDKATDSKDSETIAGAKKYADSLDGAMDTRVKALEGVVGEGGDIDGRITAVINNLDKPDTAKEGQFVTKVSETDGIITVERAALKASDIPALEIAKVTGLQGALDAKQDTVAFEGAYDKTTNKAATMADVTSAVAGLSGAMHFRGVVAPLPADTTGYASGDVILVGNKEYVCDGKAWHELGDESIYAVKGSIVDADIAANAAIAQSKIAGLTTDLADKATKAQVEAISTDLDTNYVKKADAPGYDDILTKADAATTYATQAVVAGKVDKVEGMGLSQNSYTTAEKTKLAGVAEGAQVNVIESVKVNGTTLKVEGKAVNVVVPTGALAGKNEVSKTELAEALKTEIEGKANSADLAAIATTGNCNDLIQTEGDVLVFNCGSATVNM